MIKAGRLANLGVVLTVGLYITSCAVVEPRVGIQQFPSPPGAVQDYVQATARANALRDELESKSKDIDRFDFWTGVGLVTAGLVGLSFGVFDASKEALLGAGVAGASFGAARAFVPFAARRRIYSEGQTAIACALTAISFPDAGIVASLAPKTTTTLSPLSATAPSRSNLQELANELERAGSAPSLAMPRGDGTPPDAALSAADNLLNQRATLAAQTLRNLDAELSSFDVEAAMALDATTIAVRTAVNRQIDANAYAPGASLEAARNQIDALTKQMKARVSDAREALQSARSAGAIASQTADFRAVNRSGTQEADATASLRQRATDVNDTATRADEALAEMLRDLRLPIGCFGNLLVEPVG